MLSSEKGGTLFNKLTDCCFPITLFCRHDWSFNVALLLLLPRCNSPTRGRAASFLRFLDHTRWHITVGKIPLNEWSARRRDLYLTPHKAPKRQTHPYPRRDSNPQRFNWLFSFSNISRTILSIVADRNRFTKRTLGNTNIQETLIHKKYLQEILI
jgi:hypothetical protein